MATAGEMTSMFAEALVVTEAQVAARYRALREAGLVSKGGRGAFAPQMTALDASRLLIAVMGAQGIAETSAITTLLGRSVCLVCDGDDVLAEVLGDLNLEEAIAVILRACLSYRLGQREDFERMARGAKISLSPTDLTATITRPGFSANFHPQQDKASAHLSASTDMSISDRLWFRSDRSGLQIRVSVEAAELLELAPSLGPPDAGYRRTH